MLFPYVRSFPLDDAVHAQLTSSRRFMKALQYQGLSRDSLPYKAPFQPFGSWFALVSTAIVTLFKGRPQSHRRSRSTFD